MDSWPLRIALGIRITVVGLTRLTVEQLGAVEPIRECEAIITHAGIGVGPSVRACAVICAGVAAAIVNIGTVHTVSCPARRASIASEAASTAFVLCSRCVVAFHICMI